jgi:pyruvate dehydrogenase E1 component alpha subunit
MNTVILEQYKRCWFIRSFERAIAEQASAGNVPGLVHLSTGSEVADVLLGHCVNAGRDHVTGSHRSHGLALACGAKPVAVAKEILGRQGGLSEGLAGTQHLLAPEAGFLTSNGIVGAQVPLAAGAALSAKAAANGGIGVAVFGDGAANQGAVLETMNLAVALKLPLLFVLYNNGMAQTTAATDATAGNFCDRARSFDLVAWSADSASYEVCSNAVHQAVKHTRTEGPAFLEITVTRDHGHYYGDERDGRFEPSQAIEKFGDWLAANGVPEKNLDVARQTAKNDAEAAIAEAASAPLVSPEILKPWIQPTGGVGG